jgi:hypothetical protein
METALELIGRIYDAVADPTRWREFLDALVHASNCSTGTLVLLGPRLEDASIVCSYGLRPRPMRMAGRMYCDSAVLTWCFVHSACSIRGNGEWARFLGLRLPSSAVTTKRRSANRSVGWNVRLVARAIK